MCMWFFTLAQVGFFKMSKETNFGFSNTSEEKNCLASSSAFAQLRSLHHNHLGLVVGVPAHGRGLEQEEL